MSARFDIRAVSAFHPDAEMLRARLSDALKKIVGDPGHNSFANWRDGDAGHYFVVAYRGGQPVGCGGLRDLEPGIGEIKRMYALTGNAGTGTAILAHLEGEAKRRGLARLRLETRRANGDAIRFYERRGYAHIAPYGRYVGRADACCFEKILR